jgi:hypothetical protein
VIKAQITAGWTCYIVFTGKPGETMVIDRNGPFPKEISEADRRAAWHGYKPVSISLPADFFATLA